MTGVKALGGIDLQGAKATNAADASAGTDLVTLQQMQAYVQGLDWKPSVRVAMFTNVTLTAPGATLDGVTMAAGDRVLLAGQTTASACGIYIWNGASATMTRSTDADTSAEVTSGLAVTATEGTTNGDKAYILTTNDPIVLGTTALAFSQLGGSAITYTAADASIIVSGTTIRVQLKSGGGVLLDASNGLYIDRTQAGSRPPYAADCAATTNPQTFNHALGTADVDVTVRIKSTGEIVMASVIVVDANNVSVDFGGAPTSAQYRVVVAG